MTITAELLAHARDIAGRVPVPAIREVYVPAWQPDPPMDAEFGVLVLADGSAGFFYAWLGDTLQRLGAEFDPRGLVGRGAEVPLGWLESSDDVARSFGLAALNALSQHLFARAGLELDTAASSMAEMDFSEVDHVGMVGLFPPLAERLRGRGVRLTVIERKPELVCEERDFSVTLEAARLAECNKVLITGSTLLNDTLEDILRHCRRARPVAVIGPTASCVPDPLFARGVDLVGGSRVRDVDLLLARLHAGEPWGDAVEKYLLRAGGYPGVGRLLESAG